MAFEIERRFIINSPIEDLINLLNREGFSYEGCFKENDTYFDGPNFIERKICLRIRHKAPYTVELTYKGPSTPDNEVGNLFMKEELNVSIGQTSDITPLIKMLNALGYPILVKVEKSRKIFTGDELILSIDEIDGQPQFYLEVETNSLENEDNLRRIITKIKTNVSVVENNVPYRDICLGKN